MSLRVALRIFDERLLRHLSTIISLAKQRAVPVQLVGVSDTGDNAPQVIVVCEDEPGAQVLLNASKKSNTPRVVIYGESRTNHQWVLPSPATTESLQRLVEQLQASLSIGTELPVSTASASLAVQAIEPHPLLQDIASSRAGGRVLEILLDGADVVIYVDGENDCIYAPNAVNLSDQLLYRSLLQLPAGRWRWLSQRPRSNSELQSLPLEAFIWQLAFSQSLPRLSDEQLQRTKFQLQRWPYFSQFNYSAIQLTWSAMLMRSSTSLAALVESAATPQMAYAFFNACVYAGIAEMNSSATSVKAPSSTGKRLLNALLKRLRRSE